MSVAESFLPLPLLGNPHLQTILSARVHWRQAPPSETREVDLGDGDRLAVEVSTPPGWTPARPAVFLVHGLGGSHQSSYMERMASKLYACGARAVRINLRGRGSGVGLARKPYTGGCSPDVRRVIEDFAHEEDGGRRGRRALIGYSLGGNIVLKLAAELGPEGPRFLDEVIAVCPAADLEACWQRIARPEARLYQRLFVSWLRAEVLEREATFPDLPRARLPRRLTLLEFDHLYTAPQWGFASGLDYYAQSSAAPRVPHIEVSTRIVFALDDPIICARALDRFSVPDCVRVLKLDRGGHLGFLGHPSGGGVHWLDRHLLRWVGA